MVFSPLTDRVVPHHNKFSSRQGRRPTRGINHHWAGVGGGDTRLLDPREDVSANYILYSTGELVGQVPEEYRAFTSGSWEADSWSITVEIQNVAGRFPGANDSDPRSWPISDAALAKLIALWADVGSRYGWGTINRDRIRGHREFASTACPGGFVWNRLPAIAAASDAMMKGITPVVPDPPKPKRRNEKMLGMRLNDGRGRYGKKGAWFFATRDSDGKTITYLDNSDGNEDANQVSINMGFSFANLTYKAWEGYHLQADTFIDATVDPPVKLSGPKGKPGTTVIG